MASLDTAAVNLPSDENSAIDTTPISPSREKGDFLERKLQHRPDAQDLKNRNILHDTSAAPAIQSAQHDLERQRVTDNLKKGLEKRSDRDVLVEKNILPESNAAPALQAHQKDLERHMRKDSLDKQLHNRPKPEDLIQKGILNKDENPQNP